ncbi:hypothetical protein GCM10023115_32340 [Pontixanthobacter gangjinensis]|uniref:Uncharacterized protein n=1 Tax=Christiangramia aestuarii TaxID=1028746 RepID=A0A7K1LNT2_9FLAO|nr:hypothetical protein [Christiangramia aestuarii]MUP42462.1 hypothetical protein [Christiangramia aestuarii]
MKKIELTLGTLAAIAILYKLLLGNELNTILLISMAGLSLFYTYFSFIYFNGISLKRIFKKDEYRRISTSKMLGSIALGIGLGITILGVLWSLMSWPFNSYYSLGIPLLIFIGFFAFIKFSATRAEAYIKMLKRIIVVGIIGSAFWLNPNQAFTKYEEVKAVREEPPQEIENS